jgi:hypothetical protein
MANNNASGGIGVSGLLGVLFVGLKLGGVIDWSWWWVTSPFWIPVAIVLAFFIIAALIAGLAGIAVKTIEKLEQNKKR